MDEPQSPLPTDAATDDQPDQPAFLRPTGLSAVELAARRGIGPLSPLAAEVWHGQARPCSSCGQLVRRKLKICDQCGQDLSPAMLAKMRAHSGPWYVLEHVRPFPGVSLERLVRQIRRGVLTRTTIVRGPTTDHQWRFAAETPALCRYLGCCWACQAQIRETDTTCPECGVNLNTGTVPHQRASEGVGDAGLAELDKLSAALNASPVGHPAHRPAGPARVGRVPVSWIVAGLLILTLVAILAVVRIRAGATPSTGSEETVDKVATLRRAMSYLNDSVFPDIAWHEVEGNNVYIGFKKLPDDWELVVKGAALRGNKATGFGCHVWAVQADQRGWRPGDRPYYGEATARYGRIE